MRSSVYIEGRGGERALIDAGPEFRLQALRAGIKGLDAIFLTHSHADHIHGLDDVRPLSREKPLPVYGNETTITEMKERFSYVFGAFWGADQEGGGKPRLIPYIVDSPVRIGGLVFTPVPVKHGVLDILGWEVEEGFPPENSPPDGRGLAKSFLYLTDTSAIPVSSRKQLQHSDGNFRRSIIIGGLRKRPHETHFNFEDALNAALGLGTKEIHLKEIYLTHICHEHSHTQIDDFCRHFIDNKRSFFSGLEETQIHPAWDGLKINL